MSPLTVAKITQQMLTARLLMNRSTVRMEYAVLMMRLGVRNFSVGG
jgi:hypothetical protein